MAEMLAYLIYLYGLIDIWMQNMIVPSKWRLVSAMHVSAFRVKRFDPQKNQRKFIFICN